MERKRLEGLTVVVRGSEFGGRRAPYAPISALAKFFDRIRDRQIPDRVDHNYLRKLSVAHNNEYSLLSALKFLGVLDDHGAPTVAYRNLQTTAAFKDTLWRLVTLAYKPVFDVGAETLSLEEQVNFFRVSSSASQAKNAARFFRAVCDLAGRRPWEEDAPPTGSMSGEDTAPAAAPFTSISPDETPQSTDTSRAPAVISQPAALRLALARAALLEKLPAPRPEWTAQDYLQICDRFLEMLRHLEVGS
jgi:hypothetical protein